ncbi:MAG: glycosyltransferase [Bryobacteraceae bacterium]|nr:glycosyltransferase [Bryobacteraceae bacterium]
MNGKRNCITRRIAVISEHASPFGVLGTVDSGGQNVYVAQIARYLAASGYQVDVFTRRDREDLPETVNTPDGVRIVYVPAGPASFVPKEDMLPYMDDFTRWMARFCRGQSRSYALVHANFWMSGYVACELKQQLEIPFVITFHALGRIRRKYQGKDDRFPDQRFTIEDRIVAEADRIIAECPQDEEDLIRLYNADPARITIVPCGFDPTELWPINKAQARAHLGLDAGERVVLQLGRMVPRKGVDNVLRGLGHFVRDHGIEARLLVVGGESVDGAVEQTPEIARLASIAAKENISRYVTFTGRCDREKLKYFYSAADIFVTTPWYEPFGITPVEAMACGTPVVGANVGGIKFTVRDAETGYLIPPNDPTALADRLADLYKHPRLMSVLSRQAIRRVNDLFTWQKVSSALAAVYEEVLTAGMQGHGVETDQLGIIARGFDEAVQVLEESSRRLKSSIMMVAEALGDCFTQGGKVLICGADGGVAEAHRFAADFLGRLKRDDRPGLPVIPLTIDAGFFSAGPEEVRLEQMLERQVEAMGQPGDILFGIGALGQARGMARAFAMARRLGLRCVSLVGGNGGELLELSDLSVIVPSSDAQHIREAQIVIVHLLCELVEERFVFRRRLQERPAEAPALVVKLPSRPRAVHPRKAVS